MRVNASSCVHSVGKCKCFIPALPAGVLAPAH